MLLYLAGEQLLARSIVFAPGLCLVYIVLGITFSLDHKPTRAETSKVHVVHLSTSTYTWTGGFILDLLRDPVHNN